MSRVLRSPLPIAVTAVLLLVLAYADRPLPDDAVRPDAAAYPVAAALEDGLQNLDSAATWRLCLALCFQALGAAALFWAVLAWTGNRVASAIAGVLVAIHPALREVLLGPDALMHASSAACGLGALALRELGWSSWRAGRSPVPWEVAALLLVVLAMTLGPAGVAIPLIILLVEVTFHRQEPQPRFVLPLVVLHGLVVAGFLWGLGSGGSPDSVAGPDGRLCAQLLIPGGGRVLPAVVSATALMGGLGALLLGLRSLASAPRWMAVYVGVGLCWFLASILPELFGWAPAGATRCLEGAGLAMLVPALAWRVCLAIIPEETPVPGPIPVPTPGPPVDVPVPVMAAAPVAAPTPAPPPAPAPATPFPSPPEIRDSVQVAVEAAVGSAVGAVVEAFGAANPTAPPPGSAAPGARYAAEWNQYEREWVESTERASGDLLGQEWSDRSLERNVFRNYCHPYLHAQAVVLEIGQGGGKFTNMIAPEVRRVVCLDVSRNMLARARADLSGVKNVSYVLGDGRGLAPIAPGSIDFAFSYDVFVHLDQEDMYLYLRDLFRVLTPGGRAVISFANMLDPMGFKKFLEEVGQHRTGNRAPGRINFLSPDVVNTMVDSAGLSIESLHIAANNRDMLAVLERPV